MANMYNGGPNFKSVEELAAYVDWVAKENNIDHETALAAIANANQVTIQGKKIAQWDPDESVLEEIIPEYKPVAGEAGYKEPENKSLGDTIVSTATSEIKDYFNPKKMLWRGITNGYFDGENINTNKIINDATDGKGKSKNQDNKEDKEENKETEENKKTEDKKESGLLKFGKDATSMQQIEARDKELARLMVNAGKTDISQVEELLNHYDTFKEASAENRQRTIRRIYDNIKELKANEKTEEKNKGPQWIYVDQEDYKGTPEAKEGMDMYNKYAQAEAEKGDTSNIFRKMMGEAPTSNNTQPVRQKLKDAGLSTAQINDFTQAWADAYYKVDNESPINDVKENKSTTRKEEVKKILKNSPTITGLLKSKKSK